jgi:hypothetical protein
MQKIIQILSCIICLIYSSAIFSQKAKIIISSIEDINNQLVIKYDILNSKAFHSFTIELKITNSSGEIIPANTISGDIGANINGGANKQVIWDYNSDKIVLNDDINIEVLSTKEKIINGGVSLGNALLLSTLCPGLGISKIKNGKPYWLIGVVGYGGLGASYLINKKGYDNYLSYLTNENDNLNDELLSKSQNQKQLSKTIVYTAIGVWSINLIWTAIKAKKAHKINMTMNKKGMIFFPSYNPVGKTSVLTLKIQF